MSFIVSSMDSRTIYWGGHRILYSGLYYEVLMQDPCPLGQPIMFIVTRITLSSEGHGGCQS